MSDSINGWQPPLIYDATIETRRIATQEDIDRMEVQLASLGRFFLQVRTEFEAAKQALDAYRANPG